MSNTPFDRLILDSATTSGPKMQRWGGLTDEENFEEWVIDFILDRYGLADTKTKFLLIDEEKPFQEEYAPPHASLAALRRFFPDFPLQLNAAWLSPSDKKRLTIPRLLLEPDKIFALEDFWRFPEEYHVDGTERFAHVLGGLTPKMGIADIPVFHTLLPLNVTSPGYHYVFTTKSGWRFGIERLATLFDEFDQECPSQVWMKTAKRLDFDTPLGGR